MAGLEEMDDSFGYGNGHGYGNGYGNGNGNDGYGYGNGNDGYGNGNDSDGYGNGNDGDGYGNGNDGNGNDGNGNLFVKESGVSFQKLAWVQAFHLKTLSPEDIIMCKNAEQRAVLLDFYGVDFVLSHIKGVKTLDEKRIKSASGGLLYQVLEFPIADNAFHRVVRVQCPSTRKVTTLGVPRTKETETCLGAIAWTFGESEKEYVLSKET